MPSGFDSLAGLLAFQAGWNGTGLRALPPALLFEGIAYPLDSSRILGWAPAWGRVELLDFPAQAWWGPSAAAGAVEWRPPSFTDDPRAGFTAGGGTGGFGALEGDYAQADLGLAAGYRRMPAPAFPGPSQNSGGLAASARLPGAGAWGVGASLLAVGDGSGDDWTVGLGDLRWTDGNFQRVRLRPYAQSAHSGGLEAREAGADLDYDLDLAGIAEADLMAGLSRRDGNGTDGFLQDSELIDALGDFTLDAAFRMDWTGGMPGRFSTAVGAQYRMGDALLRMDGATAQDPVDPSRGLSQFEAGFKWEGDSGGSLDLAFRHLAVPSVFNGLEARLRRPLGLLEGPVLQGPQVDFQFQYLVGLDGTGRGDGALQWTGTWFHRLGTQVALRRTGGGPLFASARLSTRLDGRCEVFLEGQDLGDIGVPWPDPGWKPGFNLMGGVHLDL